MSPLATEALERPITRSRRLGKEEIEELNIVRRDVDVERMVLDLVRFRRHSVNIRESVTAADVELSIDGAHQLTISVRDSERKLQRSGALKYAIDINVEGWWWRLVRRSKAGDDLTLTFEPRIVSYLRAHEGRIKGTRGNITRAQFVLRLVRMIKKQRIRFYCPELRKVQPLAKRDRDEQKRSDERKPGLDEDYQTEIQGDRRKINLPRFGTIKVGRGDHVLSGDVMRNLERVLTVGAEGVTINGKLERASLDVQIATMMCVLQESQGKTSATNGTHVGLFQQDPRYWPATRDPETDATAWYKAVIPKWKANKRQKLYNLVESVQRSGLPFEYAKWQDEAEEIVAEFHGGDGTFTESREVNKPYEFKVERGENFWATIIRLAEEVAWRAFTIKDKLYYISEEDLFNSKVRMRLKEGRNGVDWIDYDDDDRREVTECTVICRMKMWDAPLGSVVRVEDGTPADGKYLVVALRRSYFSPTGEITLRKPMESKPEPPNDTRTVNRTIGGQAGSARDRIVELAEASMTSKTGFRRYDQGGGLTADPTPPAGKRTDCSQWTRAIYLKAGCPDIGLNTWEQAKKGRRTRSPRPGDLMFPPGTGHVEIYVGPGGRTIGHGSPPIDYANVSAWPGHYFVTFDFLD